MLDLTSAAATNTSTLQPPPSDAPVHMAATADPFAGGCRREAGREGPWGGGRRRRPFGEYDRRGRRFGEERRERFFWETRGREEGTHFLCTTILVMPII